MTTIRQTFRFLNPSKQAVRIASQNLFITLGLNLFESFLSWWQIRFFSLQMIFRKSENVMLSVFYRCVFRPNGMEQFSAVFLILRLSSKLTIQIESREVFCTSKSALWVHLQASSEILSMHSDTTISYIFSNNIFTKVLAWLQAMSSYFFNRVK